MSKQHVVALTLALLASACATNSTGTVPGLGTGDDRLAAEKSPETMIRVGDATRAGGDPGSAIALYRRAHELAPKDPVPLARLGATFVQLRAYTEAAEAYRQAVALAPEDVEVRRGYAVLLLTIDKPALAVTHLEAALAKSKDARLYNLTGVANDLLGLHDVAQRNYAEGLRQAPNNAPLRNNLGLSQALAGDFTTAIATLSAAAASPDATPRTRQNLALVYGLAGDYEKAAAVARTDLDAAAVKSNLAYYTLLRGMDERARAAAIIGGRAPQAAVNPPQTASLAAPLEAAPQAAPTQSVEAAPLPAPSSPASPSPAATVAETPAPAPTLAEKAAPRPVAKRPPRAPAVAALKAEKPAAEQPSPTALPPAEPPVAASSPEPTAAQAPVEPVSPDTAPRQSVASAAPAASPEPSVTPAAPEPAAQPAPTEPPVASAAPAARPEPSAAQSEPEPVAQAAPTEPPVASAAPAASPPAESMPVPAPHDEPSVQSAALQPAPTKPAEPVAPTADPAPPQEQAAAAADHVPEAAQQTAAVAGGRAITAAAPSHAVPLKHSSAPRSGGRFLVQVGAFHDEARARHLCDELAAKGYEVAVSIAPVRPALRVAQASARDWFFCRSIEAADHATAAAAAERLRSAENTPALLIPAALATKQ